jgi:hypothetical protein
VNSEARRAYQREYYQRNREKIREQQRASGKTRKRKQPTPEQRAATAEYQRAYKQRNRERLKALRVAYYQENREAVMERSRQRYAQRDPEEHRAKTRAYRERNREALIAKSRAYSLSNPERIRINGTAYRHGLRPEDWAAIWDAQSGLCYLCGMTLEALAPREIQVDHDHTCCPRHRSCRICRRGLACQHCNTAIGNAADDPARLRRMADALEAAQLAVERRKAAEAQIPLFADDEISR